MTAPKTITLYETNSDIVFAQLNDGPIWALGAVTPDMHGNFATDAMAWCDGDWEPSENDGQRITLTDDGLRAVAVWDGTEQGTTYPVSQDSIGAPACLYILGVAP